VATSIFISRQFEFVETILIHRKKKRIRNSFLLAFFLHIIFFLIFTLAFDMDKKASTFTYKETVVHFADYKPIETTKSEKEYNVEQPFEKNNHTNTQKSQTFHLYRYLKGPVTMTGEKI